MFSTPASLLATLGNISYKSPRTQHDTLDERGVNKSKDVPMSSIDQFESVFRSAVSPNYEPRPFPLQSVLLMSDLDDEAERAYPMDVERFFSGSRPYKITSLPQEQSASIPTLVSQVGELAPPHHPYRHVHNEVAEHAYTLGDHIEVLTQVTDAPILLFPHPNAWPQERFVAPSRVLVLTDHLTEQPTSSMRRSLCLKRLGGSPSHTSRMRASLSAISTHL